MDEILVTYHVKNLTERIRVHGSITYYDPGSAVVLQDGSKSLWIGIMSRTSSPLRIGDLADATGFADTQNGFLTLTDGDIRDNHVLAPVAPPLLTWQQLSAGSNIFDLVSIEGQVVTEVREGNQDEYVLRAGDKLFSVRGESSTHEAGSAGLQNPGHRRVHSLRLEPVGRAGSLQNPAARL
jgi:hypothetical protein